MFGYNHLKLQIIKNNFNLLPLKSEYTCNFCNKIDHCYYHAELRYTIVSLGHSYNYYICDESHKQIKKLSRFLPLCDYLLTSYLCEDVKNIILQNIYISIECKDSRLRDRSRELQKRQAYLNYDYSKLTIIKLRELMDERKLYYKGFKTKSQYMISLQNDLESKRLKWKYDPI